MQPPMGKHVVTVKRTCSTDEEEFLSANIPGNALRSSETHLISKTSGTHHIRSHSS